MIAARWLKNRRHRARCYALASRLFIAIIIAGIGLTAASTCAADETARASSSAATQRYIEQWSTEHYTTQGTSYTSPRFDPERIGKSLDQIDIVYDYDFERLAAVEKQLQGVDRREALRHIFATICRDAKNNTERHLCVIEFLHQAIHHNRYLQPMYPDRSGVQDPLVLIELGEGRCGQVNRVAVDLFEAAGYPGRLVQVSCHVSGEVYYDGDWHFCDAGIFGHREAPRDADGTIPSHAELSQRPLEIDRLACYQSPAFRNEVNYVGRQGRSPPYVSHFFFGDDSQVARIVCYKTALPDQAKGSRYYGWEYLRSEEHTDRKVQPMSARYEPWPPQLEYVKVDPQGTRSEVHVRWQASVDGDDDVRGYRVFVSRQSRGWCYDGASLPTEIMKYKSIATSWQPEMYPRRWNLPPCEVLLHETADTTIAVSLPASGRYYFSVMPFDAHGEAVGRRLYQMSEEIVVDFSNSPQRVPLIAREGGNPLR